MASMTDSREGGASPRSWRQWREVEGARGRG
ncbi:hypothetical protein PVAP13_6NG108106 [Panicum virgatum]|uniref:Uncharacterized protein n=1 Tax=Panicum virgatum TaxID=38727 RepID=A0A8T0QXL4_PANVG|nr:hypothetical protein PVAP13_6NG108106 [Panicum virgatum]